ncbi:MAG: mammalian cell entry protein, partial [Mycobacterium sp.]
GLVHDNEAQLQPFLGKLDTVVGILQNNKDNLSQGIDGLGTYVGTLGDTVASGPFSYAYVQNLVPAQYTQPLINAMFGLPPAPLPIPEVR